MHLTRLDDLEIHLLVSFLDTIHEILQRQADNRLVVQLDQHVSDSKPALPVLDLLASKSSNVQKFAVFRTAFDANVEAVVNHEHVADILRPVSQRLVSRVTRHIDKAKL